MKSATNKKINFEPENYEESIKAQFRNFIDITKKLKKNKKVNDMKGCKNFMKKFILFLFIIINISSYSETSIEWKIEKGINPWEITVRCNLYGDQFKNYNLTVKPFGKGLGEDRVFTDGRYYDSSTKMSLVVAKKNNFQYNSEIADYECYLEKDNKYISTFKFRIKGVLIIEQ